MLKEQKLIFLHGLGEKLAYKKREYIFELVEKPAIVIAGFFMVLGLIYNFRFYINITIYFIFNNH
jgi:hypothetical protein